MSTIQKKPKRRNHPSEISENGWQKLKPHLPEAKSGQGKAGRQSVALRGVIDKQIQVAEEEEVAGG